MAAMYNLVSLLIAAALVSQQCFFEAAARQIDDKKIEFNNSLRSKALTAAKRWFVGNYIKLTPLPETVRHLAGTTTVLECKATAHPAPTVSWMKNGELISDFEEEANNEIVSTDPTSVAELITKLVVTAPSNGDVYTCVVTSDNEQKSTSTTILNVDGEDTSDVLEQLFNLPVEPLITAYYNNIMQLFGTDVILPCRVKSFSNSQVYWYDNHNKLIYDNQRIKVLPSGDLFIPSVRWTDMGDFICTAKNMYGKDSATTFVYPVKPSTGN